MKELCEDCLPYGRNWHWETFRDYKTYEPVQVKVYCASCEDWLDDSNP
jgi:hypothetical protein